MIPIRKKLSYTITNAQEKINVNDIHYTGHFNHDYGNKILRGTFMG